MKGSFSQLKTAQTSLHDVWYAIGEDFKEFIREARDGNFAWNDIQDYLKDKGHDLSLEEIGEIYEERRASRKTAQKLKNYEYGVFVYSYGEPGITEDEYQKEYMKHFTDINEASKYYGELIYGISGELDLNKYYVELHETDKPGHYEGPAMRTTWKSREGSHKTATGEMSQVDIEEGGEHYEWAKDIKDKVEKIEELTDSKLTFYEMLPFDKYQGPYARVIIHGLNDSVWSTRSEQVLFIENLDWSGSIDDLAKAINGDKEAIELVTKTTEEMRRNYGSKKKAQRGPGGGLGIGGTDFCVCPSCDYKENKERGIPCSTRICPKCGERLVGYGMPHGRGKGATEKKAQKGGKMIKGSFSQLKIGQDEEVEPKGLKPEPEEKPEEKKEEKPEEKPEKKPERKPGKPKTDEERIKDHLTMLFDEKKAKKVLDILGKDAVKLLPPRGEGLKDKDRGRDKGIGKPKTEEERAIDHEKRFPGTPLPPRGTGLQVPGKVPEIAKPIKIIPGVPQKEPEDEELKKLEGIF